MFENMQNQFNGIFGKVAPGMCRLTMNGNIAVKCNNGYKSYNLKKATLTNVTNFCFNVGDEMFFVIPTNKAKIGDIFLINREPKCVIDVSKNDMTVIDYNNSEIKHVVPEWHIFMGSVYFYGKIVSMFGNSFSKGKGMGNIMKMMMLSSMMGGNGGNFGGSGNSDNSGLTQMMAMSMFMGGGNNPFDGMFNFDEEMGDALQDDDTETDCDEDVETYENVVNNKSKTK